jgi:hypothetical protein
MDVKSYNDLEDWEKAFYGLNMKLGNDVWGARIEGDGFKGKRIRVFVNHYNLKEKVDKATGGNIAGYPIIIEEYSQEDYTFRLFALQEKEEENDTTAPTTS